jgi:hypothetical protein
MSGSSAFRVRVAQYNVTDDLNLCSTLDSVCPDHHTGATGFTGFTGPGITGPTGASAGPFAFFYGLPAGTDQGGATEYAATIAAGAAINMGHIGPAAGGIIINNPGPVTTQTNNTQFLLPNIASYEAEFHIHTTEAGQFQGTIGDGSAQVVIPGSCGGNYNPTAGGHPITQRFAFTTTLTNRILMIVNPVGNGSALTITPANGTLTHATAQTLVIRQLP